MWAREITAKKGLRNYLGNYFGDNSMARQLITLVALLVSPYHVNFEGGRFTPNF